MPGSALAGIRVIDLTQNLPGPYATMILGDFGADVIKVERPPSGDPGRVSRPVRAGIATRHELINRNKRSVVLDLKDARNRDTLLALARTADVLVEGFRPGAMARLGLGYGDLSALNPKLIYCSINGFGSSAADNPPAHDLNFMALAGLLIADREAGRCRVPATQFADIAGGALPAVIGILLALMARQASGRGQLVEIPMLGGVMALQVEALAYLAAGEIPGPGSTRLTGRYPCYNTYPTSDGRFVAVAATEAVFWRNLCAVLDTPRLVEQQYAEAAAGDAAKEELAQRFRTRTAAEWEAILVGQDTCCTVVLTPREAVERAACSSAQILTPIRLSETPATHRREAPALDEHRDQVLRDAGAA